MRQIFTFLIILISINSFCQQIDKAEYILITKAVLSNEKLVDTLKKYSHLDNHPVYEKEQVFVLDTVFINEEIYVNNSSPKFCITNISNLKAAYVNYWIMPFEIKFQNEMIHYYFKTQSINRQDYATYISGVVIINQLNNNYQVENIEFEKYQFLEPWELECEVPIECETNLNYKKVSKTNSSLFGNWQYLRDSLYYESFFSDDTIYLYDEMWARAPYDFKYKQKGDKLIVYYRGNIIEKGIEIISEDQIRIFGDYNLIFETDTFYVEENYLIERISESEFNQNDIKCWGSRSDKFDCYRESIDYKKYHEEFWRRMREYKVKMWTK